MPHRGVTRLCRSTSGQTQDVARTGEKSEWNNLLQKLMLGGSTAALFAAMPVAAFAQDSAGIEQVVVSASRIQIAGYQQPTPVSVVGAAQLLEAANADIGDTLREMPSMGNSRLPKKAPTATPATRAPWASRASICATSAPTETWSCSTASASSPRSWPAASTFRSFPTRWSSALTW